MNPIYSLIMEDSDGKKNTVGSRGAIAEDVEAYRMTLEAE